MKKIFILIFAIVLLSCKTTDVTVSENNENADSNEITKEENLSTENLVSPENMIPSENLEVELGSVGSFEKNSSAPFPYVPINEKIVGFTEIWGYLCAGQENRFSTESKLSDIAYFGAGLNSFGELTSVPNIQKIKRLGFNGRVHLVIADNGKALTHFCIDPKYSVRHKLINQIVKASQPYDGVQIDFEYVSKEDAQHFYTFLHDLYRRIPKKIISVAVPARIKTLKNDVYDYKKIVTLVDRMMIMAYDEHWSTSSPGAVASVDWCNKIAKYSASIIPRNRLVMGLPFYGRAWGDVNPSKAYRFSTLRAFMENQKIPDTEVSRKNGIPTFKYSQNVNVTVFFEDFYSVYAKFSMYEKMGVKKISFWCLGQEDPMVWSYLAIK